MNLKLQNKEDEGVDNNLTPLASNPINAGGRGTIPSGYIPMENDKIADFKNSEEKLTREFANRMEYKKSEWNPLMEYYRQKTRRHPFPGFHQLFSLINEYSRFILL